MDRRTHSMYATDAAVIWTALAVMWVVLAFTLRQVLPLASGVPTRVVMVASAVLAGVFTTSALMAVLAHLARHRAALYAEDVSHLAQHGKGRAAP